MFRAVKDTVYYIAVDGVGGAAGTVVLNYALNRPPIISTAADQTTSEDTTAAGVPFTVADAETPSTNLVVSGHSSNAALVPDYNIVVSGDGTNRTVVVTPLTNQFGTASITVTVTDGDGEEASTSFLLTVTPVNHRPSIAGLADQTTAEDAPGAAIGFTISDRETTADNLGVTGSSSNQGLVPNANIAFGGSGTNRTVTIVPATNQFGTANITITVSDSGGASATNVFVLTVDPVNDLPTISHIADQAIAERTSTAAIPFVIGDIETTAENLQLLGGSSNTNLVPDGSIVFGGAGSDRTVTVTPTDSQTGTAAITVTVLDVDGGAASDTFVLSVNSAEPLQFVSSSMLTNGVFRLRLAGAPLQNTVIQSSSNLSSWLPIFTNSGQTNMVEWIDNLATDQPRFYRAVRY